MDSKSKVRESQREILDRLIECETAIAELYAAYAEAFPDRKDFWGTLSVEESHHAKLLKTMHKFLDKGHFLYEIGRFTRQEMDILLERINAELAMGREKSTSAQGAINAAMSIEVSIIDAHFYDIVKSDAPEFAHIATHLSKATKRHLKLVEQESDRLTLLPGAAADAE